MQSLTSFTSPSGITVAVTNSDIWSKFYPLTEMIVRSQKGRKTFPGLEYTVEGLNPNAKYTVHLHMERTTDHLLQFLKGSGWGKTNTTTPRLPIQKSKHPKLEKSGKDWMASPVSFDHIRLTNNKDTVKNPDVEILMQSMHRWIPVVTIQNEENGREEEFRLEITQFFTVTAYLEKSIRDLKVELNDHASGFRKEKDTIQKSARGKKRTLVPAATENLKSSVSEGVEVQKTSLDSEYPNIPTKIHKQEETVSIQNHSPVIEAQRQKPSDSVSEVLNRIPTKIQKPEVTVPNMSLIQNHAGPGCNHHSSSIPAPAALFHVGPVYSNPLDSARNMENQWPELLRFPTPDDVMESYQPWNPHQYRQEVYGSLWGISGFDDNREDSTYRLMEL